MQQEIALQTRTSYELLVRDGRANKRSRQAQARLVAKKSRRRVDTRAMWTTANTEVNTRGVAASCNASRLLSDKPQNEMSMRHGMRIPSPRTSHVHMHDTIGRGPDNQKHTNKRNRCSREHANNVCTKRSDSDSTVASAQQCREDQTFESLPLPPSPLLTDDVPALVNNIDPARGRRRQPSYGAKITDEVAGAACHAEPVARGGPVGVDPATTLRMRKAPASFVTKNDVRRDSMRSSVLCSDASIPVHRSPFVYMTERPADTADQCSSKSLGGVQTSSVGSPALKSHAVGEGLHYHNVVELQHHNRIRTGAEEISKHNASATDLLHPAGPIVDATHIPISSLDDTRQRDGVLLLDYPPNYTPYIKSECPRVSNNDHYLYL